MKKKLELGFEYLGELSVKNILVPVHGYNVLMEPEAAGKVIGEKRFLDRFSRRTAMAAIIILFLVAGGLVSWNIYLHQSKRIEPDAVEKIRAASYEIGKIRSYGFLQFCLAYSRSRSATLCGINTTS